MHKNSINPVTIRTKGQSKITLARLGVGITDVTKRSLTVMVYDDIATCKIASCDEDTFIDAVGHLFSAGELTTCHLREDPNATLTEVNNMMATQAIDFATDTITVILRPQYFGGLLNWRPTTEQECQIEQLIPHKSWVLRNGSRGCTVQLIFESMLDFMTLLGPIREKLSKIINTEPATPTRTAPTP